MHLLALAVAIFFESMILIALVREAERVRRIIRPNSVTHTGAKARVVPAFSAYEIKSGRPVGAKDFLGRSNCVLFLDAHQRIAPRLVHALIVSVWEKITGNVYVVCQGDAAECENISSAAALPERVAQNVGLIADTTAELARTFRITSFPSAQIFDGSARLIRSGYAEPGESLSHEQ